jgi:hypothetical protein
VSQVNRTPASPAGTKPVDAAVSASEQDEEARLKLEKMRLENAQTRRNIEKLGLEINGLQHRGIEWAKAATGPVAILGLIVSVVLGYLQFRTATEARFEERFQKDVAHLSSPTRIERLMGIAGLSQILANRSESQRHEAALSFLVNALAIEQEDTVRGAAVSALAQLDPGKKEQVPLVHTALELLVDRNRLLAGRHEFSAEELTREGIENSAEAGPIVAIGKVLAGLIRRGAVVKHVNMADIACVGCDLSGPAVDLSGVDLRRSVLANADFSQAKLERAQLTDAILTGTKFFGADLRAAMLGASDEVSARYRVSARTEVEKGLFPDFSRADLSDAQFAGRVLLGKNSAGFQMDEAPLFEDADLGGVDLTSFRLLYLDHTPDFYDELFGQDWRISKPGLGLACDPPGSKVITCLLKLAEPVHQDEHRLTRLAEELAKAKNVGKAKLWHELELAVQKEAQDEAQRKQPVARPRPDSRPKHARP